MCLCKVLKNKAKQSLVRVHLAFGFWILSGGFAQGQELGAFVNTNGTGVTFRVWAPNATNVVVRGQFNDWGDLAMTKDPATGIWTVSSSAAQTGQEYKYFMQWPGNSAGAWQNDPRALWIRNGNSVIYDHNAFSWSNVTRP